MKQWTLDDAAPPRKTRPSRAALIDEAAVEKQVDAAVVPYFHIMDLAQGYRGHFVEDADGHRQRVDETTRQSRGLPDRFLIPRTGQGGCVWLEIKRPQLVIAGKIAQARYQRSWEQEQFHRLVRAAGDHIATVESAGMALSYLAFCGYAIPVEGLDPWDDACQGWYYNPRAKPAQPRARQQHKIKRRTPWGPRP